jgi:Predicted sugar phosphatases of the HAD superfamily
MEPSPPVVLCDLDGVVWLAGEPLPGAADAVARLREAGLVVGFVTNNSSLTVGEYVARLERIGIPAEPGQVLTSALTAAAMLARDLPKGARVFACAGPGVIEALEARDLMPVEDLPCEAVVVGWHPSFDFERLARASAAIRGGARFVATNLDPTYPGPRGLVPGNGALTAAVATASGRVPEVAGKPEAPTVAMVRERFGERGAVVGDRASTDGALATALGWPFALVLSEATTSSGEPAPEPSAALVGVSLEAVADAVVAILGPEAPGDGPGQSWLATQERN